jgi:SAM-dependent methyltransferase
MSGLTSGWWRDWAVLLKLASKRFQSDTHYERLQAFQGALLVRFLQQKNVDLAQPLLDLGCASGGYSRALRAAGAEVVSLDLLRPRLPVAAFVRGDALALPFADGTFPIVFCASLIEHVPRPRLLLDEIKRILGPGGLAYVSFPPFYSPVGGHQFKPYHLLGERLAIRLSGFDCEGFDTCYGSFGLFPLTIRQVRRMLCEAGLRVTDLSTRFMPLNVARVPLLGEALTWHVQFLAHRPRQ